MDNLQFTWWIHVVITWHDSPAPIISACWFHSRQGWEVPFKGHSLFVIQSVEASYCRGQGVRKKPGMLRVRLSAPTQPQGQRGWNRNPVDYDTDCQHGTYSWAPRFLTLWIWMCRNTNQLVGCFVLFWMAIWMRGNGVRDAHDRLTHSIVECTVH